MFDYQVFLCLDTYNMDAIAINKTCKLNFTVFYNVPSYEFCSGVIRAFWYEYGVLLRFIDI